MNNDLKPCPFCGSKRVRSNLYSREGNADNYEHHVYCENCSACGPIITGEKVEPGENRWDKAREAWNARCEKGE